MRHLAERVELAGVVGQLIDALQRERGATSIYLASAGQRFQSERQAALAAVRPVEASLLTLFHEQGLLTQGAAARTLSLMAWVLLDLQALAVLRQQIDQRIPTAHEAVAAYSRVIAGLVELVYQLADAAPHPGISRQLVALVHPDPGQGGGRAGTCRGRRALRLGCLQRGPAAARRQTH